MKIKSLDAGDKAPAFTARAIGGEYGESGKNVSLDEFSGRPVVLYFYPKDDTPGCTTQACGLRDAWKELSARLSGARHRGILFGVSTDSAARHAKFIKKYDLPFPLLADEDRKVAESYGVWVEKSMYGRKYMGTERSTFVIGADGTIRAVFRKVKPPEHAELLLAELARL